MPKYLTEFIGTFFLVLTVGLQGAHSADIPAFVIGIMLMCMVYMGGHVSGGHYNPAVTLAAVLAKKCAPVDLIPYWVSQLIGGIAGSAMAQMLTEQAGSIKPADLPIQTPLMVEAVFTFALALVVLNIATHKKTANNSAYGLAIGFVVVAAAYVGGPISGGAFNPAVGTGMSIFMADKSHLWLYWAGPLVGAILAALVFKVQESEPAEVAA